VVRGRAAITTYWGNICSRAMTHAVDFAVIRRADAETPSQEEVT